MLNSSLPKGPLYDPKSKIKNFIFDEDFENIRLNLLGTGGMYTDFNFVYYLGKDKEWKRPKEICDHVYFINGKPDRFDAIQGIVGDCWLVSAMEAMTLNEQLFNHVVPPGQDFNRNYIGAFHFRIWQLGIWYDVVVDDRLPVDIKNKKLIYVHSMHGNVFWAALLEKAYAKIGGKQVFSYDNLDAGYPTTAFQDFSGGLVERVETRNPPAGREIKWFINELFSQRALIGCSCHTSRTYFTEITGLELGHAYAITSVFKCADDDPDYHGLFLVRLMNPWGQREWRGHWSDDDFKLWKQIDKDIRSKINFVKRNEGEFWMNETDLVKFFDFIWVCHLGPGQFIDSHCNPKITTWSTTSFFGEWVRNVSAVGSDSENRHKNPQCNIILIQPENDPNKDGVSTIVIDLTQRSKVSRDFTPRIGFYVYPIKNVAQQKQSDHFDSYFFFHNDPIVKDIFSIGGGHACVMSFQLTPGGYCIVPCTKEENVETQFLLRVFAESQVEKWEYDQVAKAAPTEELIDNAFDEELKTLFENTAEGRQEVDWIGLTEILERKMNQNISNKQGLGLLHSIFNMFLNIFAKHFLHKPKSTEEETSYIVFSKDECRSMIAMLDEDHSGKLSFTEVSKLWKKIRFWNQVYDCYTDGEVGYLKVNKLMEALGSIGYNINNKTVHSLVYMFANDQGYIMLKDFILFGVILETALTLYQKTIINEDETKLTLGEWVQQMLMV